MDGAAKVDDYQPEEYKVVTLSTGHLTERDRDLLQEAADDQDETMVISRVYGFFIKLYPDLEPSNFRHGHSESIKEIIRWAHSNGYRMIEFDCDAAMLPQFPVYNW